MVKGLIAIAESYNYVSDGEFEIRKTNSKMIAVCAGLGTGIGEGIAASKAVEAVGRNPEAEGKIRTMMILGIALAETVAIYGLLVSLILLFVY